MGSGCRSEGTAKDCDLEGRAAGRASAKRDGRQRKIPEGLAT